MAILGDYLTPAQVCQTLRLTPMQIQLLVKAGRLEVTRQIPYKHGVMEVFSKEQVQRLAADMPKIRREWDLQQGACLGAKKAAVIREHRRQKTQALKKRKARFLDSLNGFSEQTASILRVCFYLYHLNHYAKHGHPYLYDYKEQVLYRLWQELKPSEEEQSGFLQVTFVSGPPRIHLCLDCRLKAQQQRQTHVEYLRSHEHTCTRCTKEEYYYSLYEFTLDYGEYHFCFHVPYSVARKWFAGTKIKENERSVKRDGVYVFGRPIHESEALAVELQEVVEEMEAFLTNSTE